MATYIIGDLHGCFDEFQRVLKQADFDPNQDELWLTGDLVARGEQSLECLRFVKQLGERATVVLGNHDLHLLATLQGIKPVKAKDNVEAIFNAEDRLELQTWLRNRPLVAQHPKHRFIMAHAGISPQWDLTTTLACAREVESVLQSDHFAQLLAQMYCNEPTRWSPDLQGIDRLRYIINVFTRMRFCYADNRLDFDCKLPVEQAPEALKPWFELPNPLYQEQTIFFGHWASLIGYPTPANIYALDTGCVWGNHLTLLRWEDKHIFTQPRIYSPK
ncbi:bis(5'-nucleosyl)-tetraphosphatase (symmetrical) [Muribacter muris]|uniref:Bis(5'-nucleosyl)-tetraphosphatase, symmetrical n=1 Tax=Muribacter muris TaxID=67855 RepID=A0A4Y9K1A1_9PAST|nr:bis(5'-nucleosyl)-tetraphosphatase (symmetrical) ApaH [Muribacter muris]MBF0784865.1 bis(5'-nucleosyl)-tetraphosphatase (symmetrical) ApaH [Muribacter muris]MBF0826484.1 bis(5'-nucleosyl)-tetraphosphatase (symmetrical) ApaH [Muribacter muris]TFV10939.1 bis(5'-nucleosyl)-tetraphosphatase (symmetrical) [Muribacter muris]